MTRTRLALALGSRTLVDPASVVKPSALQGSNRVLWKKAKGQPSAWFDSVAAPVDSAPVHPATFPRAPWKPFSPIAMGRFAGRGSPVLWLSGGVGGDNSLSAESERRRSHRSRGGRVEPSQPRLVLIVEDEPDMSELLRSIVEGDFGARAVIALDGETALGLAQTLKPDLVVLDLFLPRVDGLAVCRDLKASPTTHSIPVVLLTGSFQESIREQALRAGVDSFVHKVYGFHELLPLLVEHLGEPSHAVRRA